MASDRASRSGDGCDDDLLIPCDWKIGIESVYFFPVAGGKGGGALEVTYPGHIPKEIYIG